jgi:hypothetical protein
MKTKNNINYFWQLALHIQKISNSQKQGGYAMLVTSILAIMVFSMLSVYLFSTNLYKSVATAVVDSGTTFYAAEKAMNRRAYQVRRKLDDYGTPSGTAPGDPTDSAYQRMQTCIGSGLQPDVETSNDFECRISESDYLEPGENINPNAGRRADLVNKSSVKYRTYSFVQDLTPANPDLATIPVGEDFAGLKMLEYRYRVYTSAAKEIADGIVADPRSSAANARYRNRKENSLSAQTMLQMDFNDRWIPIFQFAAFYQNDLEITSSSDMTLSGPVHTNSNLRLAPGATLTFQGRATSTGDMYKSLGYTHDWSRNAQLVKVMGGNGNGVAPNNFSQFSVSGAWGGSSTNNAQLTATEIANTNGRFTPRTPALTIPPIESTDRSGIFYAKADVVVDFDPSNTSGTAQPFRIKALGVNLPENAIRSLRQPVVFTPQNTANPVPEQTAVCQNSNPAAVADSTALRTLYNGWTPAKRTALITALQTAISQETAPILYSKMTSGASSAAFASTVNFTNALTTAGFSSGTVSEQATILAAQVAQIAKLGGNCILPAPMQVLNNQLDRRELRPLTILQSNINSLTAWNRDGKYWNGSALTSTNNLLFVRKAAGVADGSYNAIGLGADDNTDGGLVWHFSLNTSTSVSAPVNSFSYNNSTKIYTYQPQKSPFGFGFSGANRLPGAISLVSDQAIYTQGSYNNINKQPSAVMADTIAVLSAGCIDNDIRFTCLRPATTLPNAVGDATISGNSGVVVNAAFLSRTDVTQVAGGVKVRDSGGLNNYARMLEAWSGLTFSYRGSFISMGAPLQFSGQYKVGNSGTIPASSDASYFYYNIPTRDFGFDTSFNSVAGLPPLTPRANYLKQKVFKRDYNATSR